jgi:hypothetical protein
MNLLSRLGIQGTRFIGSAFAGKEASGGDLLGEFGEGGELVTEDAEGGEFGGVAGFGVEG